MIDYSNFGTTQKIIASLAKVGPHAISRWISKHSVKPILSPKESSRKLRYSVEDTRRFFKDSNISPELNKKDIILSFYNFKGGTGKTSICYQVSSHLALMGYDVLVIDADPQGHLSTSLGFDNNHNYPTLSDVVNETVSIQDAIRFVYPGLQCIPSNLAVTRLEVSLNDLPKREERFQILMEQLKGQYDFIIFDTNPTISLLNRNILVCSDHISIICETQPYSLNGLKILMEDMIKFYKGMQISLPDILVVPNKYEDRSSNCAEAMTVLRQFYSNYMIPDFAIRKSEDITTSAKQSLPLAFFARANSIALEDISDLITALLHRFVKDRDTKEMS
ncbi:ParA family protein [Candidatus Paracaedibacter symbiosus]|uniref:ParA family protein n=1 Tax=Candidatus Paracaedibacter symbiosus TaxID=244582 RepID=UPI000509B6CB|nr:ParA family protein [Candidatus Paracaedibacter symbiosus]